MARYNLTMRCGCGGSLDIEDVTRRQGDKYRREFYRLHAACTKQRNSRDDA